MAVRRAICRCQKIAEEMFGACHASRYDLPEQELRSWEERIIHRRFTRESCMNNAFYANSFCRFEILASSFSRFFLFIALFYNRTKNMGN